jgi:phosphoribosylglycinamide formyltransferase 1
MKKINIAVFASGYGSNFEALAKSIKKNALNAQISLLVVDKKNAFARTKARKLGIKSIFLDPKNYGSRLAYDKKLLAIVRQEKIDLILLAGYMRILTRQFVKSYKFRIINIHPALLPAFKGVDSIKRAYLYGCKVTGVTIHFVDENVDNGPVIAQAVIQIKKGMKLEELEKKIHTIEHKLYAKVLKLFVNGKIEIHNRKVTLS